MAKDETIRRLTALEKSASTSRLLNLRATHQKYPEDADLKKSPFFKNRLLNSALIVKHRLRPHEYEYFSETPKSTVTKILLPIDSGDLKSGAHSMFVGQKDFDQVATAVFGDDLRPGAWDRRVLEFVDELPSLEDVQRVRERLASHGWPLDTAAGA